MWLGIILSVVLLVGVFAGLAWRGTVLLGDRRTVERISEQLLAELRMAARTQSTMEEMRRVAAEYRRRDGAA